MGDDDTVHSSCSEQRDRSPLVHQGCTLLTQKLAFNYEQEGQATTGIDCNGKEAAQSEERLYMHSKGFSTGFRNEHAVTSNVFGLALLVQCLHETPGCTPQFS